MPNRNARPVEDLAPFKGQGALAEGLLPVPRNEGQFARQDASVFNGLADQLNTIADTQAKTEGQNAGKVAGQDPAYRPTGATTIRGKSFEEAATATYVDTLQTKMREDVWKTYQANADNPAGLDAALTKLKGEYDAKHVFPEIRAQFDGDYLKTTMPYRHQSFRDVQEKARDQSRAALITNIDSVDRQLEIAAQMMPGPERDKQLAELTAQKDAKLRAAVDSQGITESQAATQKVKTKQLILNKAVTSEILKLPKEERSAAIDRLDQERKKGKGPVGEIADDTFESIKATVEQENRRDDTDLNRKFNAWNRDANNASRRLEQGFPIPDRERASLRLGAGMLKDPRADVVMANIDELSSVQDAFRGKTLPDMRKTLQMMETRLNAEGATDADKRKFQLASGIVGEMEKGLARDLVGTAETEGVIKPTPLDFTSGESLAATLSGRIDAAKAAGQRYETEWRAFRPEDTQRLKIALSEGGDRGLAVAEAIVKAGGRDARRLLGEISDNAPVMAHVGGLLASGQPGSREAARDAMRAVALGRDKGGQLAPFPGINEIESKATGNALQDAPQDRIATRETAKLIFQSRLPPAVDPKSKEAETLAVEAMKDAAGRHKVGGVDYGGPADYKPGWWSAYKVIVPSNIRTDRFRDVVRAIDDKVLDGLPGGRPVDPQGKPYAARQFQDAVPVIVPGGYRFAVGDPSDRTTKYLAGPGGKPLVIDIDALEPVLRAKVPAAYLGGTR